MHTTGAKHENDQINQWT